MKRVMFVALLLFMLAIPELALAGSDCLEYMPAVVQLVGTIKEEVYPGRPNFESLAKGDEPEWCLILHLDKPICLKGRPGDEIERDRKNVKKLHLVFLRGNYQNSKKMLNKRVTVTGKMSGAFTAHHHAEVLIDVDQMKLADR
jgi:hypothetical protein